MIRPAGVDGLMLPHVADEQHTVRRSETVQECPISHEDQKLLTEGDLQDDGNGMAERVGFELCQPL